MTIKSNVAELVKNEALFDNAVTGIKAGSVTFKEQVSTAVLAALHMIKRSKGNEHAKSDAAQIAKLQSIADALYEVSPRDVKVLEKFLSNLTPIKAKATTKNRRTSLVIEGTFIDCLPATAEQKEIDRIKGKPAKDGKEAKIGTEQQRWNDVVNFIDDKEFDVATGEKDSKGKTITEKRTFGGNIFDYYHAVEYFERAAPKVKTDTEKFSALIGSTTTAAKKVVAVEDAIISSLTVQGDIVAMGEAMDSQIAALKAALKVAEENKSKLTEHSNAFNRDNAEKIKAARLARRKAEDEAQAKLDAGEELTDEEKKILNIA